MKTYTATPLQVDILHDAINNARQIAMSVDRDHDTVEFLMYRIEVNLARADACVDDIEGGRNERT